MIDPEINALLGQVLDLLAQDARPLDFNFEQGFLRLGASPMKAQLLADYLPSACGRAFLREIGVIPSDTYLRPNKDGSRGVPQRLSGDPLWQTVENFAETLRTGSRKQFSLCAQYSAEVAVINKALNAGKTLADLKGGQLATAFIAPLKER